MDKLYAQSWALLIGIDKYEQTTKNKLENVIHDITHMENMLLECDYQKDNIKKILGANATKNGIRTNIKTLSEKVKTDDRVLIYYAGHGHFSTSYTEECKSGYLTPYDTVFDNTNEPDPESELKFEDLIEEIHDKIKSEHILLILNCCYSGTACIVKKQNPPPVNPQAAMLMTKSESFQIITSTDCNQVMVDHSVNPKISVFNNALEHVLCHIDDIDYSNGFISATRLSMMMRNRVREEAHEQSTTDGIVYPQTVQYGSAINEYDGEFVFKQFTEDELSRYKSRQIKYTLIEKKIIANNKFNKLFDSQIRNIIISTSQTLSACFTLGDLKNEIIEQVKKDIIFKNALEEYDQHDEKHIREISFYVYNHIMSIGIKHGKFKPQFINSSAWETCGEHGTRRC